MSAVETAVSARPDVAPAGAPARLPLPAGVLFLTQDVCTPAARTAEALATALRRAGVRVYVRDTSALRWMRAELQRCAPEKVEGWEAVGSAKLRILVDLGRCDTIASLDLNWLISPEPFLDHSMVQQVVSLWYDDLRTACVQLTATEPRGRSFQEVLKHPKVHHCFYGAAQQREARLLGLGSVRHSPLAAPAEYLLHRAKPDTANRRKLAFVGGPGGRTPPSTAAAALMAARAELEELRAVSAREVLEDSAIRSWSASEPSVRDLIEAAMELKRTTPRRPALELLIEAAAAYPRALQFLDEREEILDAALLVKLVLRYDRPAFVHRLYQRGLVDVYSAPWYWKDFGIQARPTVRFNELPALYQSYPAQLNAGYSAREAVANEKLFEIAACGRASFNPWDDEVAALFEPGAEVLLARSFRELEEQVREGLAKPSQLEVIGERARERVRRCHTWDHRLAALFDPARRLGTARSELPLPPNRLTTEAPSTP